MLEAACGVGHDLSVWLQTYVTDNVVFWIFIVLGVALVAWQWQQNRSRRLESARLAALSSGTDTAARQYGKNDS
jgi:uncharacterized membrane protein